NGFGRRDADVARAEQALLPPGAFDLPSHLAGVRDVVDDERMIEGRFGNLQRRFPEDSCMKRPPADVLAVCPKLVLRPQRAPMCFAGGKQGIRQRHRGLLGSWWGSYTLPRD